MEIIGLIVFIVVVIFIVGKLRSDPDLEKLDVNALQLQIRLMENWTSNYYKLQMPLKYEKKYEYKIARLTRAKQLLALHQSANQVASDLNYLVASADTNAARKTQISAKIDFVSKDIGITLEQAAFLLNNHYTNLKQKLVSDGISIEQADNDAFNETYHLKAQA